MTICLSDDSTVIMLLCSNLTTRKVDSEYKPYTISQWNKLTEKLIKCGKTPKDLFNIDSIVSELNIDDEEYLRIKYLISRVGNLSIVISQLNSLGINIVTRADKNYPRIYKSKLKKQAPAFLYYAGDLQLYDKQNIAVVGSRNIDESGIEFTRKFVKLVCKNNFSIISGGARGVDSIAEKTALDNDGKIIIVVSDSFSKKIKNKDIRNAILQKRCLVVSTFHPEEHFMSYNAMDRNKYIYAASKYALIVASDYKKGGTWAGAIENYKKNWASLIVRKDLQNTPIGNLKLLEMNNVYPIEDITDEFSFNNFINSQNINLSTNVISKQMSMFE